MTGGVQSNANFWFSVFLTGTCCIIPLALLSFVWHSVRLVLRERRREPPPTRLSIPA